MSLSLNLGRLNGNAPVQDRRRRCLLRGGAARTSRASELPEPTSFYLLVIKLLPRPDTQPGIWQTGFHLFPAQTSTWKFHEFAQVTPGCTWA